MDSSGISPKIQMPLVYFQHNEYDILWASLLWRLECCQYNKIHPWLLHAVRHCWCPFQCRFFEIWQYEVNWQLFSYFISHISFATLWFLFATFSFFIMIFLCNTTFIHISFCYLSICESHFIYEFRNII